jgi:hypothetical protein
MSKHYKSARSVTCPTCHASAGQPCRVIPEDLQSTGAVGDVRRLHHKERRTLARAAARRREQL